MVLRLPEPMLARPGEIPRGGGWLFEPKLDGFRCMVCTHMGFRARSRRGWDMTPFLPEFRSVLPPDVQLDGELVVLDESGRPDFHLLGARMLRRKPGIDVTYFVFDVLAVDGHPTTMNPYADRRWLLEELDLERGPVRLVATFEHGEAPVTPSRSRAPRWASASTPRAMPLTTTSPAPASSRPRRRATCLP